MNYIFDVNNKQVKIKGKREESYIKEWRYRTYTSYITLRISYLEVTQPEVKKMCKNRLNEMLTSVFFDNDLVKYLNTKTDKEIYKLECT